jgi:hypothetical protein
MGCAGVARMSACGTPLAFISAVIVFPQGCSNPGLNYGIPLGLQGNPSGLDALTHPIALTSGGLPALVFFENAVMHKSQ